MDDKQSVEDLVSASSTNPDPSSSKLIPAVTRVQRNVAEKQRRDKLNGYISELATIVPIVSKAAKRMDKTSILRLSAAYLRICKSPLNGRRKLKSFKWCPSFLNPDQVRDILESVDGFLLVAESNGKVLFTSRSVERYLGHQDIDIVGHTIYMFIHPDDVEMVKNELNRLLFAFSKKDGTKIVSRCSFYCRMKEKSQPRSEVQTYQFVHIMGALTLIEEEDGSDNTPKKSSPTFKAFIRIVDADPYNQLSFEEAIADEYITRHSLDGTIIFADHRISTITGHMPHEVTGFNAYKFIHTEDISVALFAHHLMFSSDKGTGMIVYRLRTRDDRYVFLKSVGCLQYDSSKTQVDHFVCVNQQLSDVEGKSQLKYFTNQFIPHIKGSSTSALFDSVKALQSSNSKSPTSQDGIALSALKYIQGKTEMSDPKLAKVEGDILNTISIDDSEMYQMPNANLSIEDNLLSDSNSVLKTSVSGNKNNSANCTNEFEKYSELKISPKKNIGFKNSNALLRSEESNSSIVNHSENKITLPNGQLNYHNLVISNIKSSSALINGESASILNSIASSEKAKSVSNTSYFQHSRSSKDTQLSNLNMFHILNKCKYDSTIYNGNIYQESIGNDHQYGASDDSSDVLVETPCPSGTISTLHSEYICSENTLSSPANSEDSETITLMTPMCPLRRDSVGFTGQDLTIASLKNNADFNETLASYNPLLSSTLSYEDSSSSSPSSKWSDPYQSQQFLDPLSVEDLQTGEEDLLTENIKVEHW